MTEDDLDKLFSKGESKEKPHKNKIKTEKSEQYSKISKISKALKNEINSYKNNTEISEKEVNQFFNMTSATPHVFEKDLNKNLHYKRKERI